MRILERYILSSVLKLFFTCLFTFLFLYVIIDLFSHLETILKQHISLSTLFYYYLSYLPIIFVQVSPISCLLSSLYTFARLNRDNELIAMRASGLSIFQLSKTVLIFGAIISLLVFAINDKVVPSSTLLSNRIKNQMENAKEKDKDTQVIKNLSVYGMRNRLFFINSFNPSTSTMIGITILEHDERQNVSKKIMADRGIYENGLWKFYKSITYNFDEAGQIVNEPQYLEEEIMSITEKPEEFLQQRQSPEYMSISQLGDYIWKLSQSGSKEALRKLTIEMYNRFTFPFTSLIIVLIGIPFSLRIKRRAAGLSSIGLSIMLGFLYYVVNAVSIALGNGGIIPPLLAASLSHLIAIGFSLYLILQIP